MKKLEIYTDLLGKAAYLKRKLTYIINPPNPNIKSLTYTP